MSPTLFRYIFKDLLRIFFLTLGGLTGIMSFGGMLKPLYEVGLDVSQVSQILSWSTPAMMAYSLPIAALYATTMVYGRLGADNEITACRAAGISYLWMTLPAFVLGVVTAFISVGLLCFVVPASMLRVEKIVYSNLAQLVAGQIQRKHQVQFDPSGKHVTVFALSAQVHPFDPLHPDDQLVTLVGPLITVYEPSRSKGLIPKEFYMASEATSMLHTDRAHADDVTMVTRLQNGTNFARDDSIQNAQKARVSVGDQIVGPISMKSPVRENTKFMDIYSLRTLLDHPEQSREVTRRLIGFITQDQQRQYLQSLMQDLNTGEYSTVVSDGSATYKLTRGDLPPRIDDEKLILPGTPESPARFAETRGGRQVADVEASEIRVQAVPDGVQNRMTLKLDMFDCAVTIDGVKTDRGNIPFARSMNLPMPPSIESLRSRPASEYISGSLSAENRRDLLWYLHRLKNSIISELHARMSFAVSCLVLVMVGCALGMMFRSGNFLSAFAVSVIPALLSIALVVTGQHTCENIPYDLPANWNDPLGVGLTLIWSGNAAVFVIATTLLTRLQRQ